MLNSKLQKYAQLVIKTGINLQKNQTVVINTPVECAFFARVLAEVAYKEGAREVVMQWNDELSGRIKFLNAPDEVFDEFPQWKRDFYNFYANNDAAFISIAAEDPELLKDVNPDRIFRAQKTAGLALEDYRQKLMNNENTWCVVSMPTLAWAKKVYPDVSDDKVVELLLEAILKAVKVDAENPVEAWNSHKEAMIKRRDFLNNNRFKYLHFQNAIGTDLKVELPEKHIWMGGAEKSIKGVEFIANMPTEEVFTLPKRSGANGKVVGSKPLVYNGNIIDSYTLTFEAGKVVSFFAEQGFEVLKKLLATDEGACYLGEVALVPADSPISKSDILFYNTLFDENASCHLAFGKAYPFCIEGGSELTKEELVGSDINYSLIHEDFMIGTADMTIYGITAAGKRVQIFINGNFVDLI